MAVDVEQSLLHSVRAVGGADGGMKGLHRSAVLLLLVLYVGFPLRKADLMTLAWP